jgi:hypothetical protein
MLVNWLNTMALAPASRATMRSTSSRKASILVLLWNWARLTRDRMEPFRIRWPGAALLVVVAAAALLVAAEVAAGALVGEGPCAVRSAAEGEVSRGRDQPAACGTGNTLSPGLWEHLAVGSVVSQHACNRPACMQPASTHLHSLPAHTCTADTRKAGSAHKALTRPTEPHCNQASF